MIFPKWTFTDAFQLTLAKNFDSPNLDGVDPLWMSSRRQSTTSAPTQGSPVHAVPLHSQGDTTQSAPILPMQGFDFVSSVGGGISGGSSHKTHRGDHHLKPYCTKSTLTRQTVL